MTIEQFGQTIKAKYPQYQSMNDADVGQKVLDKYPQYQSQIDNNTPVVPKENILDKAANAINKGVNFVGNLPVIKQAGQVLGGAVGLVGGAIGGVIGGTIDTGVQTVKAIQGKGFDVNSVVQHAKDTATATAKFGYGEGQQAVTASALGGAGKVVQGAVALGQGYEGAKDVISGVKTGNAEQAIQGGAALATSALMAKGVVDTKGWIINNDTLPVIKDIASAAKDKANGIVTPMLKNKLTSVASDLVKMTPKQTNSEIKWGKNTPDFLVNEGVLPEIKSSGNRLDTTDAKGALQEKYQAENTAFNEVLRDSGQYVSLDSLKNQGLSGLDESLKSRGTDLPKAKKFVNQEVDALKNNYQNEGIKSGNDLLVPVETFNNIKSGFWQKSSVARKVPGAELAADLNYQLGHTAKDIIENTVNDANIQQMNSRLGDFAQAIKVLDNANGKVIPGGFISKGVTRLAGTIAGAATGNPVSAIIGNITGGKLAEITANPQFKTGVLSKLYAKLNQTPKGRSIVEEAASILKQRGDERSSRLLLEAPKSIQLKSKTDTSRLFTQSEAQQLLDSMKIQESPKLLKAAGENPILLPEKSQTTN